MIEPEAAGPAPPAAGNAPRDPFEPPTQGNPPAPGARSDVRPGGSWASLGGSGRALRWLAAAVLVFVAVVSVFSELRFLALASSAWDLGLYQQALWSTAHGRAFYEAPDWETGGFGSFLQVHGAFVLYAIVPVYQVFPTPLTLFVIQSVVLGAAAVPIFGLARALGTSPRWSLGLAVLYLAWTPTVAGAVHDFHAEAFVPLAFAGTAYLWVRQRYAWGFLAASIGFLTMEVVPGLLVALAAFLLWERARGLDVPLRHLRDSLGWVRRLAADRAARYAAALAATSIVAYYALLLVRYDALPGLVGAPPFPSSVPPGYVIGGTPDTLGLSVSNLGVALLAKISYWVVLLALAALLPLLAPRTLVLLLPPLVFTFFTANPNYTVLGFQYGLVVAGPMFVAGAYGAARLRVLIEEHAPGPEPRRRPHRARSQWPLAFALLITVNLAASPLDPLISAPAAGYSYTLGYGLPPAGAGATALAAIVPSDATVVASDNLFPLVANDLRAYSLFWRANANLDLPFNLTTLPEYALLSEDRLASVPPWLAATAYNTSLFGLRGVAWGSPVGTVLLFERGYAGNTSSTGAPPAPTSVLAPDAFLASPGQAAVVVDGSAALGVGLRTVPGATGLAWDGPALDLARGTYRIGYLLELQPGGPAKATANDTPVLTLAADEFAQPPWYVHTLTFAELNVSSFAWTYEVVDVVAPTVEVNLPVYALDPNVGIELAEVAISPVP